MSIFIAALLLGFIFNAAPGPIFAEALRQGVHGGFRSALAVQIGSLVGDASWAILGLFGIGLLLQLDFLRLPIGIAGVAYLMYLAWDSWRSANTKIHLEQPADYHHALRSGALLSLTNPQNIAYWAAIGSALGSLGIQNPTLTDYTIYFAGFMTASVSWCFICAFLINILASKLASHWTSLTYKICALVFLLLAISALRDLFNQQQSANNSTTTFIKTQTRFNHTA